ncbi:L-ectoine synthase [Roseobacter sp. SK209-2-6]|uniref:ectoine synthase n=1 Tax=Roseobacter sp. SK209-2-6 TaxID=388739 RepID=UPI0000F3F7BD|nr:ectoine synthase [Roseobacter sp. SK209-2-6]EBA17657.1 L-ectoine synthase [Roseobacter sp. SK209-2-6]
MIIRQKQAIEATDRFVHWGNGTSHRMLVEEDGMGFTLCHTIVHAGTTTRLQYQDHLEACYCIAGSGWVEEVNGAHHPIEIGTLYALDQHDDHILTAAADADLVLVSVFNPPLTGQETHSPDAEGPSGY